MKIRAIKTAIFKPEADLLSFIAKYLPKIKEGEVLVVTSKIVALAEGRLEKKIDEQTKMKLIKRESEFVWPTKHVCLTISGGVAMADAGIDESNANGQLILLPKDSFKSAWQIYNYFKRKNKLKKFGVVITDSRCLPLRAGIIGVALGYAGFAGLKDYCQSLDIFGRPFKFSRVDVADSLAAAAVLNMGEGDEKKPLALISGADLDYTSKINKDELKIDIAEDMYGPLFRKIK